MALKCKPHLCAVLQSLRMTVRRGVIRYTHRPEVSVYLMEVEERKHLSHTQIDVLLLTLLELQFTEHQVDRKTYTNWGAAIWWNKRSSSQHSKLSEGYVLPLFTSTILEHIVAENTRYTAQCKGEIFENWQPNTVQELCACMGFMILISIIRLPHFDDHWRKDAIYHYSSNANRITRVHFRELQKCLHFTDNSTLVAPQPKTIHASETNETRHKTLGACWCKYRLCFCLQCLHWQKGWLNGIRDYGQR